MGNGPRRDIRSILMAVVIGAAVLIEGLILYFVRGAETRLGTGVLVLVAAIGISSRLGIAEHLHRQAKHLRTRRYIRLRRRVDDLLDEVRRLNGLVVDVQRGFRDPKSGEEEIAKVEGRLHEMVASLRTSAGLDDPEPAEEDIDALSTG